MEGAILRVLLDSPPTPLLSSSYARRLELLVLKLQLLPQLSALQSAIQTLTKAALGARSLALFSLPPLTRRCNCEGPPSSVWGPSWGPSSGQGRGPGRVLRRRPGRGWSCWGRDCPPPCSAHLLPSCRAAGLRRAARPHSAGAEDGKLPERGAFLGLFLGQQPWGAVALGDSVT